FENVRLGGDELDFKTGRQMKTFLFLLRRQSGSGADILGEGIGGAKIKTERDQADCDDAFAPGGKE
ncbi:MAG: hypothetical protein DME19_17665, partial [Verrucomicrobia bacterium]